MTGLRSNGRPPASLARSPGDQDGRDDVPALPLPGIGAASIGRTLRRRALTIGICGVAGAILAAYIVHRSEPFYRATAVIRLADERSSLVGNMERADPERSRIINPLLSQIEILQSRALLEQVVDAEGLRLAPTFRGFAARLLTDVHVAPDAPVDTLRLVFSDSQYTARTSAAEVQARYGEPASIGGVTFTITGRPRSEKATWPIMARSARAALLNDNLRVHVRPQTDIIDVSYQAHRPFLARRVANSIVERYRTLNARTAQEQSRRRRIFLAEQLRLTDSLLGRAQQALGSQRSRTTVYSSRSKMEAQQQALTDLELRIHELDSDRRVFQNLLAQVETATAAGSNASLRALVSSASAAGSPVVAEYFRQLLQHQGVRDSLTTGPWRSASTNPDVQRLDALIASTRQNLTEALQSHLAALDGRSASLADARNRTAASILRLPGMEAEEIRLTEDVETTRRTAEQLRSDYQRARVAEAVEAGQVEIVDLAGLPASPVGMPRPLRVVVGLLLGVFLGVVYALLREGLDKTVRRQSDLANYLGIASLGVIPKLESPGVAKRDRLAMLRSSMWSDKSPPRRTDVLVTASDEPSPGVEAYRLLRTNILFAAQLHARKTIVVTSAAPGEGKTTTVANLGVTFARDGKRVLLVDCDLRRARLHRVFRLPIAPGLLDMLPESGRLPAIRSTQIEGLFLLTRGTAPENGAEVLRSGRMLALLEELSDHFDLIIIDTPPVLAVADAVMLGAVADAVVLVIRAGRTERGEVQHVVQQFTAVGAPLAGAVLNDPSGATEEQGEYTYRTYEYAGIAQ